MWSTAVPSGACSSNAVQCPRGTLTDAESTSTWTPKNRSWLRRSVTGHRSRRRRQRGASAIGGGRCDDVCVIELRTARLLLRAWTLGDADFLYDMDSRWEVRQYIGVSPAVMTDRSEALASIERRRALDHPVHGIWVIELLSMYVWRPAWPWLRRDRCGCPTPWPGYCR